MALPSVGFDFRTLVPMYIGIDIRISYLSNAID
jgi:hypothetical protein